MKTPVNPHVSEQKFRKGNKWKSELDVFVTSPSVVSRVSALSVVQNESLPAHHAPVSVKSHYLLSCVQNMGIVWFVMEFH